MLNGEMYPPTVKDVGVEMHYPPHVHESQRFAVGHEAFGLVPGLMMYATIWLREHNRVCDVLKEIDPPVLGRREAVPDLAAYSDW